MFPSPRNLTVVAALAFALAACGSDGGSPSHDHAAHDAGAAAGAAQTPAGEMTFERIEPSADYPLTTCVVSGEELGAMGDVIAYSVDGTEVQLCCAGCLSKLKKSPDEYLAEVRGATAR